MASVLWPHIPLGWGPIWSGVWQCLRKDTESYPLALPLLSLAPQPSKTMMAYSGVFRIWAVRQPSLCPQSWLGWASSDLAVPPVPGQRTAE